MTDLPAPFGESVATAPGLEAYLGGVQMGECSCGPKYDEARRDFNSRIRTEFRGFLG